MKDNFDLKKFITEGTLSKENITEEASTPSNGMHDVILSYIKPEFRDKYQKDYKKYWTLLQTQAKPLSGSNKPQIFNRFLKDLIKNKVVSMNDLITFSEKYNDGREGIEGAAGYLFKQGSPDILQKIDTLSKENIDEEQLSYDQMIKMETMEKLAGEDNMDKLRDCSRDILLALVDNDYDDSEAIAFITQYLKNFL